MNTTVINEKMDLRKDVQTISVVCLAHATSHFAQSLLPLMFPLFIKVFGFNYAQLGFLMTVFFVVSGIGQTSSGFIVDKLGPLPVMIASVAIMMLGCFWASIANSYTDLVGVAALLGLGNSSFHPVDFTILNHRISNKRLGYAFSAHGLTGYLGWTVASLFMVAMTSAFGWHVAYAGAGVLYLLTLCMVVVYRDLLYTDAHKTPRTALQGVGFDFLRFPVVWWCFGFFMFSTITLAVVQTFSVSILQAVHLVSFESANFTLTAYLVCAAAGMFLGGFVSAKFNQYSEKVVAICMSVGALMLLLCATGWLGGIGTMIVLASTGLALGIGGPSRDMLIKKATPQGATGRVYGMVYSGLDVGFAVSPVIFGMFMDKGMFYAPLVGAAMALGVGVLMALKVGTQIESDRV